MDRHELDPISLVFGLVFTVLGLLFFAGRPATEVIRWTLPLLAVALGAAIFVMARRNRTRPDSLSERSATEPTSD